MNSINGTSASSGGSRKYPMTTRLLRLSRGTYVTLAQLLTGLIAFGMTGSGKSSGILFYVMTALMRAGYSLVILCVRADMRELVEKAAALSGRTNDVVWFKPPHVFNPFSYEASLHGGIDSVSIDNVVSGVREAANCVRRTHGPIGGSGDAIFFEDMRDIGL